MYRSPVPFARRRIGLLAVTVALPVALAACSSASSTGDSTTTTRAAGHVGATSACTLVTPAQIEATLDRSVGTATVTNSTVATACTFPPSKGNNRNDAVIVGFRAKVTPAIAATEKATVQKLQPTTTDVSGSGDSAYAFVTKVSGGETVTTLVTLVGETQVTVSSTASLAQAEDLTKLIFASLAGEAASTTTTTTTAG